MAFWEAYWKHEPWAGSWDQHAQLCTLIDCIRVGLTSGKAEDLRQFKEWMPADWDAPDEPEVDVGKQLKAAAMYFPKAE